MMMTFLWRTMSNIFVYAKVCGMKKIGLFWKFDFVAVFSYLWWLSFCQIYLSINFMKYLQQKCIVFLIKKCKNLFKVWWKLMTVDFSHTHTFWSDKIFSTVSLNFILFASCPVKEGNLLRYMLLFNMNLL